MILPGSQLALRELEKCLDAFETLCSCQMLSSNEQMLFRVRLTKRAQKLGFEWTDDGFRLQEREKASAAE